MRTACLLCACGLLAFQCRAAGAQSAAAALRPGDVAAPQAPVGDREIATDVVGFELTGALPFEKVLIEDLDSVVTASGDHLIPLRRLLEALRVDSTYQDGLLTFSLPTAAGPLDVIVDTARSVIRLNAVSHDIVVVPGVSDMTKKDEVYVDSKAVALGLGTRLEWDERAFAFVGKTEQEFAVWEHFGESLLAIETARLPTALPELLPPAAPRRLSLDFVEFELRPYVTSTGSDSAAPATLAIDSPRETFWGSALGGRYRVQVGQPTVPSRRAGTQGRTASPITFDRFEWIYTRPNAEIAVGDRAYGVSDLIFPTMRTTGVFVSGVAGFAVDTRDGRAPGAGGSFSRPQVFEGGAPNGSRVELILNGRPIQAQTVIAGLYRFEEVSLAPGTLNNVRIRITEPSGVERIIERSVFGRSIQLPRHGFAHIGGVGTNRDVRNWTAWGVTGAERVLYGVTDSLTIGTTWAAQQGAGPPPADRLTSGDREYPGSSLHRGAQVSWLPSEHLQLVGDIAFTNVEREQVSRPGRAYRARADVFPRREIRLSSQWFSYSPGFFNGENVLLSDREGYTFDLAWNINRRLKAASSGGSLRNNLDGRALDRFRMDFQKVEISAVVNPRLTAIAAANRVRNTQSAGAAMVYTLRLQANPYKSVGIDASLATHAALAASTDTELSSGLTIPGFSAYELQVASAVVRVPLDRANTVMTSYYRGPGGHRVSIAESFSPRSTPLRLTTELGYDARYGRRFFTERSEFRLDRAGRKAVGLDVRYELGRWTSYVNLTFGELFRNDGGVPRPIADPDFTPDNGAIYGRVFVDANADGYRDPDEPGVEGVRVVTDTGKKAITDRGGRFVIPSSGRSASYRVSLDMDSVPATYSPTQGIQTANVRSGNLTEINLGVSPLNSVSGIVESSTTGEESRPIAGVRVLLRQAGDGNAIGDSVTGNDGEYYLSDIKPGRYSVHVDPRTLPAGATIVEQPVVEIRPAVTPQDVKLSPIHVQQAR